MEDSFEESAAVGVGGGELRVELVAEGHEFIDLGDDAVLFGEGRESKNKLVNILSGNSRYQASCAFLQRHRKPMCC